MTVSLNPSVPALLPDFARLYAAFVNRERTYDGRVFVAVLTTGIFCRLSCPARKPKAENCRFYGSVAACMEAGFRPCLRCKPHDAVSFVASTAAVAARWRNLHQH